jgi:hypothetical protein
VSLEIGNIEEGEFVDGALSIITRLRDLALQIVMAIEFLPEAVSLDLPAAGSSSKGFGKKPPTAKFWQIRKVEIEQKRYIVIVTPPSFSEMALAQSCCWSRTQRT